MKCPKCFNDNTNEYYDSKWGLTGVFGRCKHCGNEWYIRSYAQTI